MGSYCTYSSLVKLQTCFMSLRLKTCLYAEYMMIAINGGMAKGQWTSGSLIWSKTMMELIFNPYGEFR